MPIVRFDGKCVTGVLGTAFIMRIGEMRFVITAGHVLDTAVEHGWEWGVLYKLTTGELFSASGSGYLRSKKYDLAAVPLFDFVDNLPAEVLLPGTHEFSLAEDLCTFEYSQCSIKALPDDELPAFIVDPYFHKGHAMKRFLDESDVPYMELSFPALQGASGAPVIRLVDNSVVGVVLGNRERHLSPAQVARVEIDEHKTETISYFLPMGTALDVRALADFFFDEVPKLKAELEGRLQDADT